jgi:hypothetical protein
VDRQIRKDDLFHCVADAFAGGDSVEQKHKVDERVETSGWMTR